MVYIPYRSLIEALYSLNSPPVVSFNLRRKHYWGVPDQSNGPTLEAGVGHRAFSVGVFGTARRRTLGHPCLALSSVRTPAS